jgi:hypothetical protein
MTIEIWLDQTSQPLVFEGANNAYQKGSFYCVYANGKVTKIPIEHIFRVIESYAKAEE